MQDIPLKPFGRVAQTRKQRSPVAPEMDFGPAKLFQKTNPGFPEWDAPIPWYVLASWFFMVDQQAGQIHD